MEFLIEKLNNVERMHDIPDELIDYAKDKGIVIVYGYSDDCVEFEGVLQEEYYADVYLKNGKVIENECESEYCPYFDEIKKNAYYIRPLFFEDGYVVKFETNIPHKEFKWVDEIGEPYCVGILFKLSDCK